MKKALRKLAVVLPLSDWSEELLRETFPIRLHIVSELDGLIKRQKAEIYGRQSALCREEDEACAESDRLLALLIETRRAAAESVEEIEKELERRKMK